MNFKVESLLNIVLFEHRFIAMLMTARQFDAHNSICRLSIS